MRELPGAQGAERITSPRERGVKKVSRGISKEEKNQTGFLLDV